MSPIEPHADMRQLAATHMQLFTAWMEVGFTEKQAMAMLRAAINGTMRGAA